MCGQDHILRFKLIRRYVNAQFRINMLDEGEMDRNENLWDFDIDKKCYGKVTGQGISEKACGLLQVSSSENLPELREECVTTHSELYSAVLGST